MNRAEIARILAEIYADIPEWNPTEEDVINMAADLAA